MHKLALAAAFSMALSMPSCEQKKDEAKKGAAKGAAPFNAVIRGQAAGQYMARERLLGASVVGKDGATLGTVDDLIVTPGGQIDGVIMSVGGFFGIGGKQIGVQLRALRIATADGKVTVSLPGVTADMLSAAPAYQRATAPAAKK
jgi:hypothetical protein